MNPARTTWKQKWYLFSKWVYHRINRIKLPTTDPEHLSHCRLCRERYEKWSAREEVRSKAKLRARESYGRWWNGG